MIDDIKIDKKSNKRYEHISSSNIKQVNKVLKKLDSESNIDHTTNTRAIVRNNRQTKTMKKEHNQNTISMYNESLPTQVQYEYNRRGKIK